jgi:hypothetical protein
MSRRKDPLKWKSLLLLTVALMGPGSRTARAQEAFSSPAYPPTPCTDDCWSYRYDSQVAQLPTKPPAPTPPVTPPGPPPGLPEQANGSAHDGWVLSVVKIEGNPSLQIQSEGGMQGQCGTLTFKVAGSKGEVNYLVSAAKQVQIEGSSFHATADRVTRQADGVTLRFEGNVHVRWERQGSRLELTGPRVVLNLQTGHVALDLDPAQPVVVQPCCNTFRY